MNTETIVSIKEVDGDYAGYHVTTDQQVIELEIWNKQDCCENWGYFWSNDNPDDFIGATLQEVRITDTILDTEKLVDVYDGGIMFVSLYTSSGVLQFVAYNEHNGYYGHDAIVKSKQLNHTEVL
jgi:hypothetical protein